MLGRSARFIIAASFVVGCSPNLGDVPFACDGNGVCPDGYSCRISVCVRDGVRLDATHTTRATWINPAEVFWLPSIGAGATLLVNDNFTQGHKGIYEVHVAPDGTVQAPQLLLAHGDGPAVASSVVTLPDGRYGIVTLRFPNVDANDMMLEMFGVEREVAGGTTAAIEKLFSAKTLYLGGVEPTYVGAVIDGSKMHIAWTVPSDGGETQVLHVERQGSLWNQTGATVAKLFPVKPPIPPLSGDCQLFRADDGWLTLRAGFENYALADIDPVALDTMLVATPDEPLFVWKDHTFSIRRSNYDEVSGTYDAAFVLKEKIAGTEVVDQFRLPDTASPFIGVPYNGGVLVAPVSNDTTLPTIDVAWRSPTDPLRIVASIKRQSTDPVYTARAFVRDDKAYVTWVEYHESTMDLWVGVAPFVLSGANTLVHKSISPRRVSSFPRRIP